MKKRLIAIVCLIMTFIMGLACLSGCRLITTDSDKDMQQVVAKVSIENGVEDKIYKQDLIVAYLNYGYTYVQSYGYSLEKTFNLILDGIIKDRILVQNAMKELSSEYHTSGADVYNVEKYLDSTEIVEAKYLAMSGIVGMVESFLENVTQHEGHSHEVSYKDTIPGEIRTAPKNATVKEDELSDPEKSEYVQKFENQGITSANAIDEKEGHDVAECREAFNRAVNVLKINNLLGAGYNGKDLTTSDYYKTIVKQYYESALITKYRNGMMAEERAKVDFADLEQEYQNMLEEQSAWNNEEFVTALGSSSISKPVLFGANGTYGYVYNILLGVSDIQNTKIKAIDANLSNAEKELKRREILSGTTVVDLRDTWITAGYSFDADAKVFTGDYTFAKDGANSLKFQGEVRLADGATEGKEEFSATSTVMDLDEFVAMMEEYVYGQATLDRNGVENTGSYYGGAKFDGEVVEYKAKMQELLFAFSTDSGSLNNENGYLIKPPVDGANSEEYVKTFADAGRKLLDMGGKSYLIVASDYGYHVMFFSEVYSVGEAVADNLVDYLSANFALSSEYASWQEYYQAMMADWSEWEDTNNFLYVLQESLTNAKVTNKLNVYEKNVANKYLYEQEGCVVKYEKAYADLLKA